MRFITLILITLLCFSSCKSSKRTTVVTKKEKEKIQFENNTVATIIETARAFEGVRYRYGGSSKKGMDCSGLVVTAFKSEDIALPRTTNALSTSGDWIDLKQVSKGDLLFFATKKNSRKVNHVGIVTDIKDETVEFIHSTTSKGVITSKLSERYWYLAFVQARRVL